jgi:predicted Zn-dependent protease
MPLLTRDQARALIEKTMASSRADDIQVSVNAGDETNIRFADNRITTAGTGDDLAVRISSAFGARSAVTTTNDISDAGLERAVRLSESLARLAPENPERMPLLGAQSYRELDSYVESTAAATPADRARVAQRAIDSAKKAGAQVAGFLTTTAGATALGNNKGLFAYRSSTGVDYSQTVRTSDGTGSGWAGANHPDWQQIDFDAVIARATEKALASRNPTPVEPGRYTVILEPQAAGDLVQLLAGSLDARSAAEGRSAWSKQGGGTKLGEKVVDERVTLVSDPWDPQLLSSPFDNEGLPLQRQVWIENGILKTLPASRFWAQKQNMTPTGQPNSLKMLGGSGTLQDLIAGAERAILVTRFWYIRPVNQRTLLYTGLTRDGTFLVENGKVTRSVRNMRFNESPLFMLGKLDAIGAPVRLAGDSGGLVVPPLRVRDFAFTSLSEAV